MMGFINVVGTAYSASAQAEAGDSGSAEKIMEEIQPESSHDDSRHTIELQSHPQAA